MNLTEVKIEANLCCFHFFTLGRQPLRESFKEKNQKPKVMILTDFLLVKNILQGESEFGCVSWRLCPSFRPSLASASSLSWQIPMRMGNIMMTDGQEDNHARIPACTLHLNS